MGSTTPSSNAELQKCRGLAKLMSHTSSSSSFSLSTLLSLTDNLLPFPLSSPLSTLLVLLSFLGLAESRGEVRDTRRGSSTTKPCFLQREVSSSFLKSYLFHSFSSRKDSNLGANEIGPSAETARHSFDLN